MSKGPPLPRLPFAARAALSGLAVTVLALLGWCLWRPAEIIGLSAPGAGIVWITPSAAETPPAEALPPSPSPRTAAAAAETPFPHEITPDGKVNINRAGEAALCTLPGIGEKRAAAIIAYREQHGPFHDIDDLAQVKNIPGKVRDDIRPLITVRDD